MKRAVMHEIRINALGLIAYDEDRAAVCRRHALIDVIKWCLEKEFEEGYQEGLPPQPN